MMNLSEWGRISVDVSLPLLKRLVISDQPLAISHQPLAISHQPSAISHQTIPPPQGEVASVGEPEGVT
jgi:hypothetical protein